MRSAVVITLATLIGHLILLLPFVWPPRSPVVLSQGTPRLVLG